MKIKITTNRNCLGTYSEAILAEGNVKTALGAKRLYNRAMAEYQDWRRFSPNYPVRVYIDGDRYTDMDLLDSDNPIMEALTGLHTV